MNALATIDTAPDDDRWILGFDQPADGRQWETQPWVICTRCDGGWRTADGNYAHPTAWAPLPDPQPKPTGWRRAEGTVAIFEACIGSSGWRGWSVSVQRPDGSYDEERDMLLSNSRERAERDAIEWAAKLGLPWEWHETPSNVVSFPSKAFPRGLPPGPGDVA